MEKRKIGRTAKANLILMAELGVPEAQKYQSVFGFHDKILRYLPKSVRISIGAVAEILYTSANHRIEEKGNPFMVQLLL